MFDYVNTFLEHPREMLLFLAMALPGRLLAISAHEFGHAWVAYRCGDPTAKQMGRLTLNPLKHLDPIGALMMLFLGFGWAKPVPVNPGNFLHPRRDDLKVSLAGVAMNAILFLTGCLGMYAWLAGFFGSLESVPMARLRDGVAAITTYTDGSVCLFDGEYLYTIRDLMRNAPYLGGGFLEPLQGKAASVVYQMLGYFVQTNLALFVFNLIPMPPLDGYHVVNDLLLKQDLFAGRKAMQICTAIMFALMLTGVLSKGMGIAIDWVFSRVGDVANAAFAALGLV